MLSQWNGTFDNILPLDQNLILDHHVYDRVV